MLIYLKSSTLCWWISIFHHNFCHIAFKHPGKKSRLKKINLCFHQWCIYVKVSLNKWPITLLTSRDSNLTISIVCLCMCASVHPSVHLSSILQFTFLTFNFLINQLSHQSTLFIFSSTYGDFEDFSSCLVFTGILKSF